MKRYRVTYKVGDNHSAVSAYVNASSASQAREQIKARYCNKTVKIIACVES